MRHFRGFVGSVAVVTGAASGIGRALAFALAGQGCKIAISDVDEVGLERTRAEVALRGAEVDARRLDVASREAVHAYADDVMGRFGQVNVVVNNAGVALGATVAEMSIEDMEWLMGINFWGVVYGTKAFLPHLEQSEWGHIVNLSSIFGIIGVPTQAAYNASKFAVRGFTEALRQELDQSDGNVSCTSVHPGGIATNIARNSRCGGLGMFHKSKETLVADFDKLARTSPEEAARVILDAVQGDKRRALIGRDAYLVDTVQRALPVLYQRILAELNKRRGG